MVNIAMMALIFSNIFRKKKVNSLKKFVWLYIEKGFSETLDIAKVSFSSF